MRVVLTVLMLAMPGFAQAFDLVDLVGDWRGNGSLEREGKQPEEVRCRLKVEEVEGLSLRLSGRCATEAGARNIAIEMVDMGGGEVMAWDGTGRDGSAREVLMGRFAGDRLTLSGVDGEVSLSFDTNVMVLQSNGRDDQGELRSTVEFLR